MDSFCRDTLRVHLRQAGGAIIGESRTLAEYVRFRSQWSRWQTLLHRESCS